MDTNKWFLNFIKDLCVLKTSASTHRLEDLFFLVLFSSLVLQCNSYVMAGGYVAGVVGGRLLSRLTGCHTQPTPGNLMS